MRRPRSILLTGGCGFIGSHMVDKLLSVYSPDVRLVVVDRLDECSNEKNLEYAKTYPFFKFFKTDVNNPDFIMNILETYAIDTVLHFAAMSHVDNSFGNSLEFTRSNVLGTHAFLEAVNAYHKKTGHIKLFVHVSTDEVYGENRESKEIYNEDSTFFPTNPYASSKAGAECVAFSYLHSYDLPIIVTRGNNVYGTRQYPEKLIPKFVNLAMRNMPLFVHGKGTQTRSFMHVNDVTAAFLKIIECGEIGKIYNIGTKEEYTVLQVAELILKHLPESKSKLELVSDRNFNDQRYKIDTSRLESLGWKCKHELTQDISGIINWYKNNPMYWENIEHLMKPHPKK